MSHFIDAHSHDPLGPIPSQSRFVRIERREFVFELEVLLMESDGYVLVKYPDHISPDLYIDNSSISKTDEFLYRSPTFHTLPNGIFLDLPLPFPYGWVHKHHYGFIKPSTNSRATFLLKSDF